MPKKEKMPRWIFFDPDDIEGSVERSIQIQKWLDELTKEENRRHEER